MNTDSTTMGNTGQCALGFTSEDISTWLADGLDESEAKRISDHIPTCSVCQAHLAAYTLIDTALRDEAPPQPSPILWEQLRPQLTQTARQAHARHMPSGWRTLVGGLATLAAILLLAVGFFQLFRNQSATTPTLTPAPTLAPASLDWKAVKFPAGSVLASGHYLAVPSSDGNTAYVCAIASSAPSGDTLSGTASVWVTHDRGANWSQTHALPAVGHAVNSCYVIVDDYQPSTALVVVSWSQSPTPNVTPDTAASFVTTDGGASWGALTDPRVFGVAQLATVNGRTYGLVNSGCNKNLPTTIENDCLWHLYAISDSWRTWRPIDQQPTAHSGPIGARGFWIEPGTGTIWEATLQQGATTEDLWKSLDGGSHWQQVKTPIISAFLGQASSDGHRMYLCGFAYAGTDLQTPQDGAYTIYCSNDGGASWHGRPIPATLTKNAVISFNLANDGANFLISIADDAQTFYRLEAQATQWQSLGKLPGSKGLFVRYYVGAFWTLPPYSARSGVATPLKDIGVFTADYP